jgi:hypothetical protein
VGHHINVCIRKGTEMRARLSGEEDGGLLLVTVTRLAPERNVEFFGGSSRLASLRAAGVRGDGPHGGDC